MLVFALVLFFPDESTDEHKNLSGSRMDAMFAKQLV